MSRPSQTDPSAYTPLSAKPGTDDDTSAQSLAESQASSARNASSNSRRSMSGKSNKAPAASTHDHQRKRGRRLKAWLSNWWKEVTAAVCLVGAAVASFATLYPYQNRPLPEWPYYITIGALLSTYSVSLRTAASYLLAGGLAQLKWLWYNDEQPLLDLYTYDDATRGPFGALKLLWKLRFIPSTWQWLGCLLVLVTLLTGPFTQQVLQYTPCYVLDMDAANQLAIPRTSVFLGQGAPRPIRGMNGRFLTPAEQGSVNTGMYGVGPIGVGCASGNCSAPSYASIGYCAKCEDLSPEVHVVVNKTTSIYGTNLYNTTTFLTNGLNVTYAFLQAERFLGLTLATFGRPPVASGLSAALQFVVGLPGAARDPVTGLSPTGCDDFATNQTWRCQGFGAASCSMYPCIRTYKAEVVKGLVQESIVDEYDVFGSGTWPTLDPVYAAIEVACLSNDDRSLLRRAGYSFEDQATWIPYNMTNGGNASFHIAIRDIEESPPVDYAAMAAFENRTADRGCLYATDADFQQGLIAYLDDVSSGDIVGSRADVYDAASAQDVTTISQLSGPQLPQVLYNWGNYSMDRTQSVFDNISISLTNYMRAHSGEDLFNSSRPATGDTFTTKTCVDVQWVWLSLPWALALLTLIFFVAVTVLSHNLPQDVRTWKSSPLPLMFHAPRFWDQYTHIDSMEEEADSIRVRLETSDIGIPNLEEK